MLDKKSYVLLKELYKVEYLNNEQIEQITHSHTQPNELDETALYLSRKHLIFRHYDKTDNNGNHLYDGYTINSDGRAYIEERRKSFLLFILPYGITTLIALLSLFTSIATNWDKVYHFLTTIAQMLH